MYLFCDTLLLSVTVSCLDLVACDYPGTDGTGNVVPGRLRRDQDMECWQGTHRVIGGFALFILFWYVT